MLLRGQKANGPSVFFHRETILKLGGYIGARNCADWPTVIKLAQNDIKIHYYPEPLVYYRRHGNNVSSFETLPWKKIAYEMRSIRNTQLLKKNLSIKLKFFCLLDLLRHKKEAEIKLTNAELVIYTLLRPLKKLFR